LPYVVRLAHGVEDTLAAGSGLRGGLSVRVGRLTDTAVADQGRESTTPEEDISAALA
jgi:alanine dehydrogenase